MLIEDKTLLRDLLVVLVGLPNTQIMWRSTASNAVSTKSESGICGNIRDLRRKGDEFVGNGGNINTILDRLFRKWPKFSGNQDYPIPGGFDAFSKCAPFYFWEGEQGQLRVELCNFLIDELNKELEANG